MALCKPPRYSAREVEEQFHFGSEITCKICGKKFQHPRPPAPGGRGFWGFGLKGTRKGLLGALLSNHLRGHEARGEWKPASPAGGRGMP